MGTDGDRQRDRELEALARRLGAALTARGWMLASAESCTGGLVAGAVTAIAGSSGWFERGFVTYSNEAKQELLGVRAQTLAEHGAVSEATVLEMAAGALRAGRAQASVAVSGVAGPDGGSPDKPVGSVWLAWAHAGAAPRAQLFRFDGDRTAVRRQAVVAALEGLIDECERESGT